MIIFHLSVRLQVLPENCEYLAKCYWVAKAQKLQNGQEWPWKALWRQRGRKTGHLFSAATYTLPFRVLLRTLPWRGPPLKGDDSNWERGRPALCSGSAAIARRRRGWSALTPSYWRLPSHKREPKWPIFVLHVSFSSIPSLSGRFW